MLEPEQLAGQRVIGVIPARMASSRFFGKPLAKILGKEMIGWVYENAASCSTLDDVYVATDGEEISEYCKRQGIPCVMTSPDHRNCSERSNEVCRKVGGDFVAEIQGDEPTLGGYAIDAFIQESLESDFDVALAYAEISPVDAENAHIVKVAMDHRSRALFFSRFAIPHNFKGRKNVSYYGQGGLYLWRAAALERFAATEPSVPQYPSHGLAQLLVRATYAAGHPRQGRFAPVKGDLHGLHRAAPQVQSDGPPQSLPE